MINTNGHTQTVQYPEETDKLISSTCTAETIPTNKCLVTGEYADDCTLPIYDGSESSTRAKVTLCCTIFSPFPVIIPSGLYFTLIAKLNGRTP